jgi:ribosomal protein L37AE/L43A
MARNAISSTFKEQRKREGSFRCEQCDSTWPLSHRRRQDGLWVCKLRCHRAMGKDDIQRALADAVRESKTQQNPYHKYPVRSVMGVPHARLYEPSSVRIAPGGSAEVEVTGYLLDEMTFSSGGPVDVTSAVAEDGLSATLTITAEVDSDPADYDLVPSSGHARKKFIKIREGA